MKRALVLGGGGLVGISFHAGALMALEEAGLGIGPSELVVGTSAGGVVAAHLRSGWSPQRIYEEAGGAPIGFDEKGALLEPLWRGPGERLRRAVGGSFAGCSARGWWRKVAGRKLPSTALRRRFPSGFYSNRDFRGRLEATLPQAWPDGPLGLSAAELYSGRRVFFGGRDESRASFPQAVLATSAIVGFLPPVCVGGRYYVDGGVSSPTSMDFALAQGCRDIICVAPLGLRRSGPRTAPSAWKDALIRAPYCRRLRRELEHAEGVGARVLLVCPQESELAARGGSSMRVHDRFEVAEAARLGTLQMLETI